MEYKGYRVTFVQNFTDIDDKMIQRAKEEGTTVRELGEHYIAEYFRDADRLGIRRADHYPRATEHIDDIIAFIRVLVDKGLAYPAGEDVYYDTAAFPSYGKLSGQSLEIWRRVPGWTSTKERKIPWILHCGKAKSRESRPGTAPGVPEGRAGILNAPPWPPNTWE